MYSKTNYFYFFLDITRTKLKKKIPDVLFQIISSTTHV